MVVDSDFASPEPFFYEHPVYFQVTRDFWRAIGGDEDELAGLSDDDED